VGLRDLLLGHGTSVASGRVDIEVLRVRTNPPSACIRRRATVSAKPFTSLVSRAAARMSENIATRSPQQPADIGFREHTTEPVYRMLSIANAVPGSSTAETLIETYKDVIALDYAETF